MIEGVANEYIEIHNAPLFFYCGLPTVEAMENAFKSLDGDSALRLDMVPTRILKRCAKVLAPVLHMLTDAMITF